MWSSRPTSMLSLSKQERRFSVNWAWVEFWENCWFSQLLSFYPSFILLTYRMVFVRFFMGHYSTLLEYLPVQVEKLPWLLSLWALILNIWLHKPKDYTILKLICFHSNIFPSSCIYWFQTMSNKRFSTDDDLWRSFV